MEVMWKGILTLSLLCWGLCSSEITCKNKNGASVDWYILYKVPKLNNKDLTGLEYFYIDTDHSEWHNAINDPKGVLANTLAPLLAWKAPTPNFGFISYNDQPPGCNADKAFGHSKGVLMTDKTAGVWLLHSTPNFPYDRKQKILWPETGAKYGQTFICVTFPYATFNQIGQHLQYIRAFPFDYDIPGDFHPSLQSVVKRQDFKPTNPFLDQDLKSRLGVNFKSFAKYSSNIMNAKDLYLHAARQLKSDLSVRSWRGSRESDASDSDSDCSEAGRTVNTVDFVEMTLERGGGKRVKVSWTDCQDHSKWCVTEDHSKAWTCIADLNKAQSQNERPGGALCIEGSKVRDAFKEFIEHKEDCPV